MREMAIRTALGAGRRRIVRQLLTESLVMSIGGGALGLLLAVWGKELLLAFSPGNIPRFDEISVDATVFSFTLGITFLTTLIFGLVPALASSKVDLTTSLKEGGQKGGGDARHNRARNLFVVLEVAFALMLLIGAGLMIKSFVRLQRVDPGFDPDNILTLEISLPGSKYKEDPQLISFFQQALERIKSLPTVGDAAVTLALPSQGPAWTSDFTIEGRAPEDYGKEVRHNVVSSDYFRTMKVPLAGGRLFTDYDDKDHPMVVVINEALARGFFSNEDPIGKRLKFSKPEVEDDWITIVGVVKNEKLEGLAAEVKPEVYQSFLQTANNSANFVVRTTTDPRALTTAVRKEISAIDKDIPVFNVKTMKGVLYESVARERFTVLLLTIFAGVALILSAVGIYGVMSYAVTERTHEIGIRMALGANTSDVLKLVVRQGIRLALAGVVVGVAGAFALTRLMANLLFGVGATDPLTFTVISLLLTFVALLACWLPARRAAKVDPMVALRYE
jgi:putative ABC transport system permease protein